MSTYYNSYCPHCEHTLNRNMGIATKYSGCPIKSCPQCGKTYCDPRYFEPALEPYKQHSIPRLFFGSLPLAFTVAVLVLAATYLITRSDDLTWTITAIGFVLSWLIIFLCSVKNRDSIEEKRLKEWQESEQRLCDPQYAALLKSARFDVPARYLPLEFSPDPESVPKKTKEKAYLSRS